MRLSRAKLMIRNLKAIRNMSTKTNAAAVREFNIAADQPAPNTPSAMTREEVDFIGKMIIDELLELYATVMEPNEAKAAVASHVDAAKSEPLIKYDTTTDAGLAVKVGDQADAFVDIWYYSLNAAAKKGMNLSALFDTVHAANMAKVDPVTGKCLKRGDGKIIKPAGWTAPDITGEMLKQIRHGSFEKKEVKEVDNSQ